MEIEYKIVVKDGTPRYQASYQGREVSIFPDKDSLNFRVEIFLDGNMIANENFHRIFSVYAYVDKILESSITKEREHAFKKEK